MTASSADTAEFPRVAERGVPGPAAAGRPGAPRMPGPSPVHAAPVPHVRRRAELRAERREARRRRRRFAALGLAVLGSGLGATIAVLVLVH